ncbi:MAG: prepilin peptidase [Moraxellaceae bacterium]|nr:prepilin peptidase [Moraxellaceae bacterium]
MREWTMFFLLAVIVLPAAWIDFRQRRIPNELCLAGILLGVMYHLLTAGVSGAGFSLLSFLLAFAAGFPLWLLGWMGAGDVKLVAAVGAIVGMKLVLPVLAGVAIAGGAVALVYLVALRLQDEPLYVIVASSLASPKTGDQQSQKTVDDVPGSLSVKKKGIPYAIPVALGSLAAIVYVS